MTRDSRTINLVVDSLRFCSGWNVRKPIMRGVVSSFWDVEARSWGLWCPDRRPHSWGHTGHTGKQPPPLLFHLLPPTPSSSSSSFSPFSRPAPHLLFLFSLSPILPLFFLLLLLFPFFSPSLANKGLGLAIFEIRSDFFFKGEVNPIFFIPPLGQNWAN